MTEDCLFCKIVAGEIPSTAVIDREQVYAFRDIAPAAPTHVLVVPKRHIPDITQIGEGDADLLAQMFKAANEVAAADGLEPSGYRLSINQGHDAGQTVFHLHLHVLGGKPLGGMAG